MNQPKPITVQSAEISTASVEVKTITVSKKQMTLSMFKQLYSEPLISEDGEFRGNPWGVVNYHPDDCDPSAVLTPSRRAYKTADMRKKHWHVVWQLGSELRRSAVYEGVTWEHDFPRPGPYPSRPGEPVTDDEAYGQLVSTFIQAACCANGHARPEWMTQKISTYGDVSVLFISGDLSFEGSPPSPHQTGMTCPATAEQDARAAWEALSAAVPGVLQARADEVARIDRHRARWAELAALPQLFIAV